MFIAAKYEEVYAPSINQFVYIADGGYSNEELIKAERYMLAMLDFNLQYPNPLNFLRRCSKADGYDLETRNYSKYLMEVAMLDEQLLSFPPSMIAASSMYLSRYVLNRGKWVSYFCN
jgi:G2/mitotic-specific cyclin 1/2